MQKFVLRSALRPDQISFSHSLDPLLTLPTFNWCTARARRVRGRLKWARGGDGFDQAEGRRASVPSGSRTQCSTAQSVLMPAEFDHPPHLRFVLLNHRSPWVIVIVLGPVVTLRRTGYYRPAMKSLLPIRICDLESRTSVPRAPR
jgi:hypothetical protein